jgi:serine/threonine protein kinase
LIKHILCKDPAQRFDAEQILNHPWVVGEGTPEVEILTIPEQLKEYNAKKKLKKNI